MVTNLLPQSVLFNPVDFCGEFCISFGLIFPRITVLLFVIADILLPSVIAFIYDTEIATVQNTRTCFVLYFDCENACGILGIIVSENGKSIGVGNSIKTLVKDVSYFFSGIVFVRVVDFDIHIKVKTNIGVPVAGYHPSLAAAYKMILEGKVFSDFVLQSVNDI